MTSVVKASNEPADGHLAERAAHARRSGGRGRLRRVVYVYDEDSDDSAAEECYSLSGREDRVSKRGAGESADTSGTVTAVDVRRRRSRGGAGHGHCSACCAETARRRQEPRIGSPTPLGFYAFGITTALYNVHTAGICTMNFATLGLVLFFGGLTQFVCGFFELINRNTLGCTISATYGAFWMATMCLYVFPADLQTALPATQGGNPHYMGGFFLIWALFALSLFACGFNGGPIAFKLLFALVPINFFLQSMGHFTDTPTLIKVAGFEGIVAGSLAAYIGMALSMRDVYGISVLPLGMYDGCRLTDYVREKPDAAGKENYDDDDDV